MKTGWSAELKAHLAGEVTTVSVQLKLERLDGEKFFFTSLDKDIEIDGDTYESDLGMLPSGLTQTEGPAVDNVQAVAFFDSTKVTKADIAARLWDYAIADMFIVNYEDLTMGKGYLFQGWRFGDLEQGDNSFQAELQAKARHLGQQMMPVYSPDCPHDLGDSDCGVDLSSAYTVEFEVTSVLDRRTFIDESLIDSSGEDVFTHGLVTWLEQDSGESYTGNNAGFSMEVKSFDAETGAIELFEAMPYDIEIGDQGDVTYGCDKRFPTCRDRYGNQGAFGGFPHLPGLDRILNVETSPDV